MTLEITATQVLALLNAVELHLQGEIPKTLAQGRRLSGLETTLRSYLAYRMDRAAQSGQGS